MKKRNQTPKEKLVLDKFSVATLNAVNSIYGGLIALPTSNEHIAEIHVLRFKKEKS